MFNRKPIALCGIRKQVDDVPCYWLVIGWWHSSSASYLLSPRGDLLVCSDKLEGKEKDATTLNMRQWLIIAFSLAKIVMIFFDISSTHSLSRECSLVGARMENARYGVGTTEWDKLIFDHWSSIFNLIIDLWSLILSPFARLEQLGQLEVLEVLHHHTDSEKRELIFDLWLKFDLWSLWSTHAFRSHIAWSLIALFAFCSVNELRR